MAEKEYTIRLMVHGDEVYRTTIEAVSPQSALNWGFYWLPNHWIHRDRCAGIHAEVARPIGDGRISPWKGYDCDVLEDASHIRGFDDDDLQSLLRGQDLVWRLVDRDGKPVNGMLFKRHHDAECFDREHNLFAWTEHIWVDGWYDEEWTWRDVPPKGYEDAKMPKKG